MPDKTGNFIICPYCDSVHENKCDYPSSLALGNEIVMNCWECGKTYTVRAEAIWTFYTSKIEKENRNETKTKLTLKE